MRESNQNPLRPGAADTVLSSPSQYPGSTAGGGGGRNKSSAHSKTLDAAKLAVLASPLTGKGANLRASEIMSSTTQGFGAG